ncbi:MAG: glycosyltransferase [Campylobacterales bacterium]|nr:glycosyltransferase [Campylobacterales bacterium]HEO98694.1 glycosyltransferase [Campylobacterota bacterium]
MAETICLDKKFSTTRLVTEDKPSLKHDSEDKFESVLFFPENSERKGEGGLRTKGYFKRSFENKPLISIITVVFNGEKYLEETIQSVINQNYDNVEYIIIDGGSADGTIEIIKKYEDQVDYWVSEKDEGISDAFNKGIQNVYGYILMLNAGDILVDKGILNRVSNELTQPIVAYEVKNSAGRKVGLAHYREDTLYNLSRVPHQGTFVHKLVYEDIGGYSKSLKLRMDYEFFVRAMMKYKPKLVYEVVTIYDISGISSSLNHKYRFEVEGVIIEYLYLGESIWRVCYVPMYRLFKSAFGKILRRLRLRA